MFIAPLTTNFARPLKDKRAVTQPYLVNCRADSWLAAILACIPASAFCAMDQLLWQEPPSKQQPLRCYPRGKDE
jgi:hypothetical protein